MPLIENLLCTVAGSGLTLASQQAIRFFRERRNPSFQLARRFREAFLAHGITRSEIPDLVPWDWSQDTVKDDSTLIKHLGRDQTDWVVETSGLRRQWLLNGETEKYDPIWGYKEPARMIVQLNELGMLNPYANVTAFVDEKHLRRGRLIRDANVLLVFSSPINQEVDDSPKKYVVCGDDWNWGHWPCRRDVKAIVRYMFRDHVASIPIVPVESGVLSNLREGKSFPQKLIPSHRGSLSRLEDYALTASESVIAKESEEANAVVQYFDEQLGNIGITRSKLIPSMVFAAT